MTLLTPAPNITSNDVARSVASVGYFLLVWLVATMTETQNNRQLPHHYIALYKPALTLCTFHPDEEHRIQKKGRRDTLLDIDDTLHTLGLHCVGRLDRETEGLLLLTTDGKFTAEVHAKCCKRYWVLVEGTPSSAAVEQMGMGGLEIRGAVTRPPVGLRVLSDEIVVAKTLPKPVPGMDRKGTWMEIVLDEGRNRQVRRIMKMAGHKVIRLCRVAVGGVEIRNNIQLKPGEWKAFEKNQVFEGID
jgi:23S rRNA pseudouridine2457 synthase